MRLIVPVLALLSLALFLYLRMAPVVCIGAACVPVELALTPSEQEVGLMGRTVLDGGMLFVFPQEDRYGFWMRNMGFPIDIVWISSGKMVVDVSPSVLPCGDSCPVHYPASPVKYVLEVPANYSRENGIRPGARAVFLGVAD